jgi:tetratricopeptide (TPR) repeat protein
MNTSTHPIPRIFVSHSHIDNDFGTRLAQDLKHVLDDENAVWYDVLGGLHGGEAWWEKIVEELTARNVFIVVLSPEAMNSRWVRREIDMALNEDKLIVPLHYRACTIRADLKIIQIISFLAPKTYEAAFNEVLNALGLLPIKLQPSASNSVDSTTSIARHLIQQIEAAFVGQDWPDVIRKANLLIKRAPEDVSATTYRMMGIALREEGNIPLAQDAFETALALVSDRQQRLTLLSDYASLLAGQEQWTEVLLRTKEALRLAPNDPGWLTTQQQAQNELKRAAPVVKQNERQWLNETPNTSPATQKTKEQWLSKGMDHLKTGRATEALAAYGRAIALDPNYANAYNGKGNALRTLERYDEALEAYEQAIRLNPRQFGAYTNKGSTLYTIRRYKEKLEDCEQAIRLNPNFPYAYKIRCDALRGLKHYNEALEAYDHAIALDPDFADAYNGKGNTLDLLGRAEEAQQAYEKSQHAPRLPGTGSGGCERRYPVQIGTVSKSKSLERGSP